MNELIPTKPDLTKRMTSVEIAELTGKRHKNVRRDVEKLIEQKAIGRLNFEQSSYINSQNKEQPMYELDFQATMTLVTGYDAKRRAAVVKRWIALETGEAEPALKAATKSTLTPITKEYRAAVQMAKLSGLSGNQAILKAAQLTRKITGQSPLNLLEIELESPSQARLLTPSDIGVQLSNGTKISARKVNEILAKIGLQESHRDIVFKIRKILLDIKRSLSYLIYQKEMLWNLR